MRPSSRSRNRQRGATIIMMLIMMPLLMIPLVGLAIDGTRLYIVQSKLSAAVDGAALGAGRLLGTNANTKEIAQEFLNVNFPANYWQSTPAQANIQFDDGSTPGPNLGVQTISIYATTTLPLTFARMLGQTGALLSASGVATRRVTRVEIVLDRSGSMDNTDPVTGANVFTTMKAGAQWFASQFSPGYDEVGLIVFSGSAVVAYPEGRPWDPTPSGVGGPDKTFATNPQTQTGQIFDQLTAMGVGGGTGTPEALAMAFIEMQKTHNRDLAANAVDNALNTIVLFTDGVPDSVASYVNDPNHNSLKPFNAGTNNKCANNPATSGTANTQMRGYIVAGGSPTSASGSGGWSGSYGLLRLAALDTTDTLTTWLGKGATGNGQPGSGGTGALDLTKGNPFVSLTGCVYLAENFNGTNDNKDLAKIPDQDLYGYSTAGTGFTNSVLYDGTHTWHPNSGITYNNLAPTDPNMVAAASWNLTDTVGKAIRTQAAMNQIQIFTIGYSGNGGTDIGLLQRLSNTPPPGSGVLTGSSSFVASEPIGKFYLVNNTTQLQQAFDSIASSLLRLSY